MSDSFLDLLNENGFSVSEGRVTDPAIVAAFASFAKNARVIVASLDATEDDLHKFATIAETYSAANNGRVLDVIHADSADVAKIKSGIKSRAKTKKMIAVFSTLSNDSGEPVAVVATRKGK